VGDTLTQASQIFHDHLNQSAALAEWWKRLPAAQRDNFERTIGQLATASRYIGNEIVIAVSARSRQASPVILAQITKPGLDVYLKSQLPPSVFNGHMRFDNGLFVAAADATELDRIADTGDFLHTPLYRHVAPAYQQGAGWLFAADLQRIPVGPKVPAIADARYLVAESRTVGANTENRASVTFSKDRQGVAAWLAAPGPMGSLEFVSPDAGFAASLLLKNPALIADDMMGMLARQAGQVADVDLRNDLAGAFGGEVTVALDGPVLPVPSLKIAAEVYYPARLESSLEKFVAAFNSQGDRTRTGDLKLSQSEGDGRTYYKLKFEKLPWEADWTFIDGYWLAAANHELLVRSIQNRETGYTLPKSKAFRAQLPHDASANFSAVVYHNLAPTLAPIYSLLGSTNMKLPRFDDHPGAICFWAAPDRIDVSTMGSIFGMNIESLLSMQGSGPLSMLSPALAGVKQ
jgi:hypothetical protein